MIEKYETCATDDTEWADLEPGSHVVWSHIILNEKHVELSEEERVIKARLVADGQKEISTSE